MTNRQEQLIQMALEILRHRSNDKMRSSTSRSAYNSAVFMLEYALDENYEALCQFDDRPGEDPLRYL